MTIRVLTGDCRELLQRLPDNSVQCCVTSPPYYGLRDYGTATWTGGDVAGCDHVVGEITTGLGLAALGEKYRGGGHKVSEPKPMTARGTCPKCGAQRVDSQIGLEATPDAYIAEMVAVFREVRRVLRADGTLWLNIGDSYAAGGNGGGAPNCKQRTNIGSLLPPKKAPSGTKPKDLLLMPARLALALQVDGWYVRSDIIWCLSGGSHVYARTLKGEGPLMVKDMARLDLAHVSLWTGSRWTPVLGMGKSNDISERIELVLRSGERIGCTGSHLWPTHRGDVAAQDLVVGDCLRAVEIPEDDFPSPPYLTNELAWLAGLYLAKGNPSRKCLQLSLNADEAAWAERIKEAVRPLGGVVWHQTYDNSLLVRVYGSVVIAAVEELVTWAGAKRVHLNPKAWRLSNDLLRSVAQGYLDGDGHHDAPNGRYRLGFCRNYALERDLRALAARLGATITLNTTTSAYQNGSRPSFKGEWRWERSGHRNEKDRCEIFEIRRSRAREFWDISVKDESHLFALSSGVLTHNCKPNPMPESVTDRPTSAHEHVFLLTKSERYFYDAEAVKERSEMKPQGRNTRRADHPKGDAGRQPHTQPEGGTSYASRNLRNVWTIATRPYRGAHFATMPPTVVETCVKAGTSEHGCCGACGAPYRRIIEKGEPDLEHQRACGGDVDGQYSGQAIKDYAAAGAQDASATKARILAGMVERKTVGWQQTCTCPPAPVQPCVVLDPFGGAGTTAMVAQQLGRDAIMIELNPAYVILAGERFASECGAVPQEAA